MPPLRVLAAIGAKAVPVVRIIMYLLWIVAKPISMVLDFALGAEMGTTYTKGQITELLQMQVKAAIISDLQGTVMSGALKLKEEVGAIMTKMEDVVCIQADVELDFSTLSKVFQSGYSRIPVLAPGSMDIIGIMYARTTATALACPAAWHATLTRRVVYADRLCLQVC